MTWLFYILLVLFLFVCVVLTLLVLIQKGRGGGLASAFGGGGTGNTAFGSKTGDVLTWATSVVFGIFLLLAIAMNLVANRLHAANTDIIPAAAPAPIPVQANGATSPPGDVAAPERIAPGAEAESATPPASPTTTPAAQPGN